jgi:hypothetical protein
MPERRRKRRDAYLSEHLAEEAAIEGLTQDEERIGGITELGWARGLDWLEQEQPRLTERQREALILRFWIVVDKGEETAFVGLSKPGSWMEVGESMRPPVSRQAARRIAEQGAAKAGLSPEELNQLGNRRSEGRNRLI